MTRDEILREVKNVLFGTAEGQEFRDAQLKLYIEEVISFMMRAGVSEEVALSPSSVVTIAIGVNDLWNYSSGDSRLSPYFMQRVTQLKL